MTPNAPRLPDLPSHEILEGLARLHPFVLLTDCNGRIHWMNQRLREELCGAHKPTGDVLQTRLPHHELLEGFRKDIQERHSIDQIRLELVRHDASRLFVEASTFLVESADTDEPRFVIVARPELTGAHRTRVERERDETAELLAAVLDSAPDGVLATDRTGFITYANPAFAEFLGRGASDLVGKPVALFLPTSHGFEGLLEKLRRPEGWNGEELELQRSDGQPAWVSISTRALRLPSGRRGGLVTFLRDVTKQHRMQEQLQRKNAELEGYVDSVAHDLRTPLVSLLGFTRLLRQDYEDVLDETGHHFLDRVEQAGRSMEALIHDLLELSRIGKPAEYGSLLDPRSVLLQLEAELKLRLEEEKVELVLPAAPPLMRVDPTRLYQVFSNLIGNALRHMGPCDRPHIEVSIQEFPDQHQISVIDNGRGIAPEDQDRIFEVFQTGPPAEKDVRRSHGIGLAIVEKIAQTHGGRVWLESEPGHGARFHVTFPRP